MCFLLTKLHLNLTVHFIPLQRQQCTKFNLKTKWFENWLNWLGLPVKVGSLPVWWHMQVKDRAVCLVLLMAFLPPLLTFSSWIRLDCIARTSLGLYTLLEEGCLCSWIHWLQMGDLPLLWVAWSYTVTTIGTYSTATFHKLWQPKHPWPLRHSHWTCWGHMQHLCFGELPGFEWQQSF